LAESPEYFLVLPPPWQNSVRFPTARRSRANSYIAVIHYFIDARPALCRDRRGRAIN
jgi:hypothetical protein